jgi:hypothetical protein
VQGPRKGKRTVQEQSSSDRQGRVVDLRAWRNRKRIEDLKHRLGNRRNNIRTGGMVLAGTACVLAVLSCIPTRAQSHLILLCWLVSLISIGYALFLHVRYDKTARRVFSASLLSMALSFVVAVCKVWI